MQPNTAFLNHLDDPSITWHAFRPMDLGFLEKTAREGLPTSSRLPSGWWSLCVSGSPGTSVKEGHGIDSFLSYTMAPTRLAVAVRATETGRPEPGLLFFNDEYLMTRPTPPSGIVAVAGNDRMLATPLTQLRLDPNAMERTRQFDYLQSNIDWIGRVCGPEVKERLQQRYLPPMPAGEGRGQISADSTASRQASILREAAGHLRAELGREPTVADAVEHTLRRAGSVATIVAWDDRTRHALRHVHKYPPPQQAIMPSVTELVRDPQRQPPPLMPTPTPTTPTPTTPTPTTPTPTMPTPTMPTLTAVPMTAAAAANVRSVSPVGSARESGWRKFRNRLSRSTPDARNTPARAAAAPSPPGQTR
ncbi:hypothetical protein [Actinoplanes sp. NPDC051851]|uniref:hypothetical protein n=1 Tax=Actinoplanes sp. NPDC051851 TaxID=3154753 RepID=UPI003429C2C1